MTCMKGHEETGSVVGLLDADLKETIRELLEKDNKTIIFLMADHGMRSVFTFD